MERNIHFSVLLVCPYRTESEYAVLPIVMLLASKGNQVLHLFGIK